MKSNPYSLKQERVHTRQLRAHTAKIKNKYIDEQTYLHILFLAFWKQKHQDSHLHKMLKTVINF